MTPARTAARITEVLVVTEHPLFADALRTLVGARHPQAAVAAARPGVELDRLGAALRPDVVLLDAHVAHAAATCERLRRWYPDALVLSLAPDDRGPMTRCATTIDEALDAIGAAIRGWQDGRRWRLDHGARYQPAHREAQASWGALSAREREIVTLLDLGLANKEIAARLGITVATAKNHVHHILGKLAVKSRGQAAARVRMEHDGDARAHA